MSEAQRQIAIARKVIRIALDTLDRAEKAIIQSHGSKKGRRGKDGRSSEPTKPAPTPPGPEMAK